jgi:GNAT superfamily N-acetyltransferase
MLVRPFRQADMPVAAKLLRQLGYEIPAEELARRFARVLAAPGHHVAVAEQASRVVALLHVFERPALEKPCEAIVQALVVDEGLRGQGIGKALMQTAEVWAQARGLCSVALHTRRAQGFYTPLGYSRASTSELMRKRLAKEEAP